jgi:hypothetical protein
MLRWHVNLKGGQQRPPVEGGCQAPAALAAIQPATAGSRARQTSTESSTSRCAGHQQQNERRQLQVRSCWQNQCVGAAAAEAVEQSN